MNKIKVEKLSLLLVLIILFVGCKKKCAEPDCKSCGIAENLPSQPEEIISTEEKIQNLDNYLSEKAEDGQWFNVIYEEANEVLYCKGFGCADACKVRNAASTVFDVSSFTKVFTATAIMQLIENDQVSLTQTLDHYFDEVPSDKAGITISQLLTHSSGLHKFHDKRGDFEKMDRSKALKRIFKQDLAFNPGSGFNYSNSGFTLLAYLIEDITGLSYEDYISQNIFQPLGMSRSGFYGNFNGDPDVAVGYGGECEAENKPSTWTSPTGALIGNGGVITTGEDLLKFYEGLIDHTLINEETWMRMTAGERANSDYDGIYDEDVLQGLAWNVVEQSGTGKIIFMGGTNDYGFVSRIRLYEDQNAVLILLMNNFKNEMDEPVISETVLQKIEGILF